MHLVKADIKTIHTPKASRTTTTGTHRHLRFHITFRRRSKLKLMTNGMLHNTSRVPILISKAMIAHHSTTLTLVKTGRASTVRIEAIVAIAKASEAATNRTNLDQTTPVTTKFRTALTMIHQKFLFRL